MLFVADAVVVVVCDVTPLLPSDDVTTGVMTVVVVEGCGCLRSTDDDDAETYHG